jgi:hypothetical protein
MYDSLLFGCRSSVADVIFAPVSNQCPQGPPIREHSHLNVAGTESNRNVVYGELSDTLNAARFAFNRRKGAAVGVVPVHNRSAPLDSAKLTSQVSFANP